MILNSWITVCQHMGHMGPTWGHLHNSQLTAVPLRVVVLDDLKQLLVEDNNVSFPNLRNQRPGESQPSVVVPCNKSPELRLRFPVMTEANREVAWTHLQLGRRAEWTLAQSDQRGAISQYIDGRVDRSGNS
jgi:hypothetical protein